VSIIRRPEGLGGGAAGNRIPDRTVLQAAARTSENRAMVLPLGVEPSNHL
jgi:hypothetical protein